MTSEPAKVVARIAPIPAAYWNPEKAPTSVLEYVVYKDIRIWSRYRKQDEIDDMIAAVAEVSRSEYRPALTLVEEFWCDTQSGAYLIEVYPDLETAVEIDDGLRIIGETFSRALIARCAGHNGIAVRCGGKDYAVEPWWDMDRMMMMLPGE